MSKSWTDTKAKKDHKCTLCGGVILKSFLYVYHRVTPWDHPDNESFFSYRAHLTCNKVWSEIGDDWDYEFPEMGDHQDFREAMRCRRDRGEIVVEEGVCFGHEHQEGGDEG